MRARQLLRFVALLAFLSGCGSDRIKRALAPDVNRDPVWSSDSATIASKPEVLYRVLETSNGHEAVPIALVGSRGFREFLLSNRGWRAFDLENLHVGHTLVQYRDGRALGDIPLKRGMWGAGGPPLDSVAGCNVLLPSGLVDVATGVRLLTTRKRPPLKPSLTLSEGELQAALSKVPTLIAPIKGIPLSLLPRYTRTVHLIDNGSGGKPTIVLMYDDPEVVSDTVAIQNERPRQLVLFLDNGVYGYRTSFSYVTVGTRKALPRLRWLDFLDVDDDGKAEALFGISLPEFPLYTQVIRKRGEDWAEGARYNHRRCTG